MLSQCSLATERWAVLGGFPDYEISDQGRVRRITQGGRRYPAGYVLTPKKHGKGYLVYSLKTGEGKDKTVLAHRLVALAFIGDPPSAEYEVAHNDGTRTNNVASNLRWSTAKENQADRKRHGTFHHGEWCGSSKLKATDVSEIRDAYAKHGKPYVGGRVTYKTLASKYGVSEAQISRVVNMAHWAGNE